MHKRKILAGVLLAMILSGTVSGCAKKDSEQEGTLTQETVDVLVEPPWPTLAPTPTEVPHRDLGGLEIIIGDYWTPEDAAEPCVYVPPTARKLYEEAIMEKYNFTLKRKCVAGWGEMEEAYIESVQTGEPIAQIVDLEYRFLSKPLSMGLFYDLATLEELDFSEDKWNRDVMDAMTFGDSVYGMRAELSVPRGGVIFNKRLFEEAGIDPELPYDLQAAGEWTWSKFKELCEILTRDTDGDGQIDVYATVSQGAQTMQSLVSSAGVDFVGKDESGCFYNNLYSKEVQDALQFAVDLYRKGYEMPQPEGTDWDYFMPAFLEGKAAMQFGEQYWCQYDGIYGSEMEDEIGFVMPPKPDGADAYHNYSCDNVLVIPSCYDEETAGDIAFAYNLYSALIPEDTSRTNWKYDYWMKDERAVNETLEYYNDGKSTSYLVRMLPEGLDDVIGWDLLWCYPFEETTPKEQIEKIAKDWDAIIAEANKVREK